MRFLAPPALSSRTSPLHRRRCLPPYVPSPGFLTLSTVFSSTACPALFHAGALMEFHFPSELSILDRSSDRLSTIRCPPAVHASESLPPPTGWRRPPRRGVQAAPECSRSSSDRSWVRRGVGRSLGSRALLPGTSPEPCKGGCYPDHALRCSPGLRSLSRVFPSHRVSVSARRPSCLLPRASLRARRQAAARLACSSKSVRGGHGRAPEGARRTLLRFSYLVDVLSSVEAVLRWLMVSPRVQQPRCRGLGALFAQ